MIGIGLLWFMLLMPQIRSAEAWQVQWGHAELSGDADLTYSITDGSPVFEGTSQFIFRQDDTQECVITFEEMEEICASKGVKIDREWFK